MIVLPMAGLSSRFFTAGYSVPKYMLPLQGRSVFNHALSSFSAQWTDEPVVIICRDVYQTPDFIRDECAAMGLPANRVKLVVLEAETDGQAETVARGLQEASVALDDPLTIFNIDTFRPGFQYPRAFDLAQIDGYVEVFQGPGTHWSFVRPDPAHPEQLRALEVAEKVRISDLCSTGLYYFRAAQVFLDLYAPIAAKPPAELQGGERYVAPLYNDAIKAGCDIRYHVIDRAEVHFCGTPDEYQALMQGPYAEQP